MARVKAMLLHFPESIRTVAPQANGKGDSAAITAWDLVTEAGPRGMPQARLDRLAADLLDELVTALESEHASPLPPRRPASSLEHRPRPRRRVPNPPARLTRRATMPSARLASAVCGSQPTRYCAYFA
ncbi:MAG: hypothetical protein LBC97_10160 [Bifidobacteriaceae bacterium]|jgi:hypothetical protein|nr:hypothetical protein [Bifidobacteriaceae bacterium]